jgi:hypothetical protein
LATYAAGRRAKLAAKRTKSKVKGKVVEKKACDGCGLIKKADHFDKDLAVKGGLQRLCKVCQAADSDDSPDQVIYR